MFRISSSAYFSSFFAGNNDIPLHYNPPVEHPESFYGDLSRELTKYTFPENSVMAGLNSVDEFNESFLQGGYYVVNVSGMIRFVSKINHFQEFSKSLIAFL